jgi:hypothetical protein
MSDLRTHHGYAVNVKDHHAYAHEPATADAIELLGEDETQAIYEQHQEVFWEDAAAIARDHGFDTVYSEGRSGGWLVPDPQPDDLDLAEVWEWERETFLPFKRAIEALQEETTAGFQTALNEAAEELRTARRNNELAAAVWRY